MIQSIVRWTTTVLMVSVALYGETGINNSIIFEAIPPAKNITEKSTLQTTKKVTINNQEQQIDFQRLMVTGQQDNNETFGLIKDINDTSIKFEDGSNYICNGTNGVQGAGLDFSSILQKNNRLYMVNQFECAIGAMYLFELEQNRTTGILTPKPNTLHFISQKSEFGGFVHCAGMATPWNSHLGSEEYESDARLIEQSTDAKTNLSADPYYNELAKYFKDDAKAVNPYFYGWVPEVQIDEKGEPNYSKHYAMGRFSHEVSYIMPDNKTVYMADDGTNVGLFMFVADKEQDLSAGQLYAAKFKQTSAKNGGAFELSWIDLGYTSDEQIREVVATKPKFSMLFESTLPNKDGSCKSDFTSINTVHGEECLKLRKGVDEAIVSRLESRRYAAYKGATTELRKEEGITYNPESNTLYISLSSLEYGMENYQKLGEKNSQYDRGGNNDIQLPYNRCGAIYALPLNQKYRADRMEAILTGTMIKKDAHGNSCDLNGIANPDNISFLKGSTLLTIGEDSSYHENNMVWAYDVVSKRLSRIISAPLGAEATSLFWYEDINGVAYLTMVTQHPNKETEDSGQSSIGILGPIKLK